MRDLHVADAGDFGKLGLPKHLTGSSGSGQHLKLGVIWYYWDEQAFSYINSPNYGGPLAACDVDLYQALTQIAAVRNGMVDQLERAGLLPDNVVYFREGIPPKRPARVAWFQRALNVVRSCEVVFLDPDIGLEEDGDRKHAHFDEASAL